MKKTATLALFGLFLTTLPAFAFGFHHYVEADQLKGWIEQGKKIIIVDIQPPDQFARHHIRGAVETDAFPAKTDEDKKRLDAVLPLIAASPQEEVVVVCPNGATGAKNAYDYLKSKGVAESRLAILEDGMGGWPYPELCVKGK